jgi:apolipoprotein N-acyltransferase
MGLLGVWLGDRPRWVQILVLWPMAAVLAYLAFTPPHWWWLLALSAIGLALPFIPKRRGLNGSADR